ncbi:MAG TPA: hypothetical protein ENG06_04000 [Thermoplasmatales archaeon]|nr:MAG: hypothetical protein DRN07_01250 [Thermoplasmata archaeon]HDN50919.1 hypothetical protein [Thermoplasmatales archaeon]
MELKTPDDLKKYLEGFKTHPHHTKDFVFGIELEGALVDTEGRPLDARETIATLNSIYHDFQFSGEAGACQIEIKSSPREFSTEVLKEKEAYLEDVIEDIVKTASRYHRKDVIFLLLGANPHPDVLSDRWISQNKRAQRMAEWRSRFPPVKIADMLIDPRHIALSIQSLHVTIQGKDPEDTADKYNRLTAMVPEHIAFSANSPVVGGKVVDYAEARLLLYEMADGGHGGFPKLKRYPTTILEYAEYIFSHQSIMAETLPDMVKERHEDNRIKFDIPFRVENRICSAQPTIKENMALVEYIVGRLKYAQRWSRQDFPSMKEIEINRMEAIKESVRGTFVWFGKAVPAKTYLLECIEKAEKGLQALDAHPRYLHLLKRRVRKRKTCADVVRKWYRRSSGSVDERVASLVNRVWEHTRKNDPIL